MPKYDSFLDAVFNIPSKKKQKESSWLFSDASKKKERRVDREECPECGTLMVPGGNCPGCGLHDEEMDWEDD